MEMSLDQYVVLIGALYYLFYAFVLQARNFRSALFFKYIPFLLGLSLLWTLRDFIS